MTSISTNTVAASLPVVVIGAGVSGLYTAYLLHQKGIRPVIYEARPRIGGRIISAELPKLDSKTPTKSSPLERYDLGPSWYWPGQDRMHYLVKSLGLQSFPQYSKGAYVYDAGVGKKPMHFEAGQDSSMRVAGGMQAIVEALHDKLPEGTVKLSTKVTGVELVGEDSNTSTDGKMMEIETKNEDGASVLVRLDGKNGKEEIKASHVIFALPPRLIVEGSIKVSPKFPKKISSALSALPTWMAPHAKFVAVYDEAFWRQAGLSGSGSSQFGVLGEIHEASPVEGKPALFGFLGISASERKRHGEEKIKKEAVKQLGRMFGSKGAKPDHVMMVDWANEPYTASHVDIIEGGRRGHPHGGLPSEADNLWDGRLTFAGTEVATEHGGFLEGALTAAESAAELVLDRIAARVQARKEIASSSKKRIASSSQ